MARMTKVCQFCHRFFVTGNYYQMYCPDCEEERMKAFKDNRRFVSCATCGGIFLSIGGQKHCPRCRRLLQNRGDNNAD